MTQLILSGCQDADPLVRAAAVVSMGRWDEACEASLSVLASLLEDANDQVKLEAMRALPKLAGATPAVIEGLCRRLLEDDCEQVQAHAALALGKLGPAAEAAGGPLLHAAQNGEMNVREQAMRAIALIQPPETTQAFVAGLKDASDDIRTLASAGWMNAAAISEEAIPALVEALRDPAAQVRANAANALARLDAIPADAVPLLIECTADANDGLRLNAAMALKLFPASAVAEVMQHLLADQNPRCAWSPRVTCSRRNRMTPKPAPSWWMHWQLRFLGSARRHSICSSLSERGARQFSKNFRNSTDPMVTRNRRKPLILLSNPSTSDLAKDLAAEGKHLGLRGVMGLRWVGARFSTLSAGGLLRGVGTRVGFAGSEPVFGRLGFSAASRLVFRQLFRLRQ